MTCDDPSTAGPSEPIARQSDAAEAPALCALAVAAVRAGGQAARARFGRPIAVRRKADGSEVSDADLAAQDAVLRVIIAARPGDAFVTEETPLDDTSSNAPRRAAARVTWAIDPIDGTRNYIRGVPLYACSVAALVGGTPVCGAIYAPQLELLYSSVRGDAPRVNGGPMPAAAAGKSGAAERNPAPVVAIPSQSQGEAARIAHAWVDRFVTRSLGSAALQLAMVATGQLQAMLNADGKLWDIAAGWRILLDSGGVMVRLDGRPLFPLDVARYAGEPLPAIAASDPAGFEKVRPAAERSINSRR